MNARRFLPLVFSIPSLAGLLSCSSPDSVSNANPPAAADQADLAQTPTWSRADLDFFLHGSMSTEFVPTRVLRAFISIYPDLFPKADLSNFGLIPDAAVGFPIGLSRREVPHLGGEPALGLNCASCHVGEVLSAPAARPTRLLGVTSHFDAEAFFGAVIGATFRTADLANMKRFLPAYLAASDSPGAAAGQARLAAEWQRQEQAVRAVLAADPSGAKGLEPGALHEIKSADLRLDQQTLEQGQELARLVQSILKLFHNMRTALHIPDQLPDQAPPASGPGRNDAFGLLSAVFFQAPQAHSPVKYGLVWNLDSRRWVHWDGNTQSPIGRNLLAALGLGAPLLGKKGQLDFAQLQRHTALTERIRAPKYPFAVDQAAAQRGAVHYNAQCASCHDGPEGDRRLYAVEEIGTDGQRIKLFNQVQADRFNRFLRELEVVGYQPGSTPGIRSTQKLWSPSLAAVWARSPYLHNGSVRTMKDLLSAPNSRADRFRRGSKVYDAADMGYLDEGLYLLDTRQPGNSNAGHDYGTDLSASQKRELIEHLKTL